MTKSSRNSVAPVLVGSDIQARRDDQSVTDAQNQYPEEAARRL